MSTVRLVAGALLCASVFVIVATHGTAKAALAGRMLNLGRAESFRLAAAAL